MTGATPEDTAGFRDPGGSNGDAPMAGRRSMTWKILAPATRACAKDENVGRDAFGWSEVQIKEVLEYQHINWLRW